jgi:DNA polymerase III delta prime subunit
VVSHVTVSHWWKFDPKWLKWHSELQSQINRKMMSNDSNVITSYNLKLNRKRSKTTQMTLLVTISNWSENDVRLLEWLCWFLPQTDRRIIQDDSNEKASLQSRIDREMITYYSNEIDRYNFKLIEKIQDGSNDTASYNLKFIW